MKAGKTLFWPDDDSAYLAKTLPQLFVIIYIILERKKMHINHFKSPT